MRVENIPLKQGGTAALATLSGIIAVKSHFQKFMMQTYRLESTQIQVKVFRYFRINSLFKALILSSLHFKTIAEPFYIFFYSEADNVQQTCCLSTSYKKVEASQ